MIRVKTGVSFIGVQPQVFHAIGVAASVWREFGADVLWVTSLNDSAHKVGSKHYDGHAADLRVTNLPRSTWATVTAKLQAAIGPQFDVLLELDPPHVHVEFDPKPLGP